MTLGQELKISETRVAKKKKKKAVPHDIERTHRVNFRVHARYAAAAADKQLDLSDNADETLQLATMQQ